MYSCGMNRWAPAAALRCTLMMAVLAGCSKSSPPNKPPESSASSTSAVAEAPLPTPSLSDSALSDVETRANVYFQDYLRHLRQGDLIQADATLRVLNGLLGEGERAKTLWETMIPSEFRRTLHVAVVCTTCTDGTCPSCHGNGLCTNCSGTGLCPACKGTGGEWKTCLSCLCPTCRGAKVCMECRGRGTVPCSSCKGSGEGPAEQRFEPCPSCKGLGYKEGLLRGDGTRDRYTCLLCKGAKGTTITIRPACQTCGGTGRVPCGRCGGTGRCPTCKGTGRQLPCPICQGKGRYFEPCSVCKGEKVCDLCHGTRRCPVCGGHGRCPECRGRNAVIRYRLPVDQRWLSDPSALLTVSDREGIRRIREPRDPLTETIGGRAVTLEAPNGTLLWLSTTEGLGRIREWFK